MEFILNKVTQQAMNYAIRSGITITSGFAIDQCARLLKTKTGKEKDELQTLQKRLENKIRIIAPAIDMIELITARGNTSLESAVTLTKTLRWDIQALGVRLSTAAANEELARRSSSKAKSKAQNEIELSKIVSEMRKLLERIEDAVPLINLAITTSGVSLSTSLPSSVSPSRLLQASTFLSAGDARYSTSPSCCVQIGPTFTLSMYMLFLGHASAARDEESLRSSVWKEVIHKARLKLMRTSIEKLDELPFPSSTAPEDAGLGGEFYYNTMHASAHRDEYAYQIVLVEDLEDGRVHTTEDGESEPSSFGDVKEAGIRTTIPIHEISKLFYADTGKILNIRSDGETNNPIILLKRDPNAVPPRRMLESEYEAEDDDDYDEISDKPKDRYQDPKTVESELDAQILRDISTPPDLSTARARNSKWEVTPDLDPEWIALEVYNEDVDSDSEDEAPLTARGSTPATQEQPSRHSSVGPVTTAMSSLELESSPGDSGRDLSPQIEKQALSNPALTTSVGKQNIQTSLSLLEMLIRLTSLQQFQQASHLTINDELLNFFLRESSTTGTPSGDAEARQRVRMDARMRLGFDPYDESPVKPHGEDYQIQTSQGSTGVAERSGNWNSYDRSPSHIQSSPLRVRDHETASPSTRVTRSSSPRLGNVRSSMTSFGTPPNTSSPKGRDGSRRQMEVQSSPLARGELR